MKDGLLCAGLSVALHAALLALAGRIVLSGSDLPVRIPVSLVIGRGDARPPGSNPGASAAETLVAASPSLAEPQRALQPRAARRPMIAAKRPREPSSSHSKPSAPQPSASGAASASGGVQAGLERGGGFGSGSGESGGSGDGTGGDSDLRALCVHCPQPQYPRLARLRRWEGRVDIDVAVGIDGHVHTAAIASSSGYTVLDDAALAAARQSRFQLSRTDAALRGRIEYGFRLSRE